MSALRELIAAFGIDVDTKKLAHADSLVEGFKEKLEGMGRSLGAAFAVYEVKEFIGRQIELGSQLRDTADRLGVGTEELQKFQYAARLNGVAAEDAAHALGFLNRNVGLAITGNQAAAQAFAQAGVALKDSNGQVRPMADLTADLADKLEGMGSQAERTAIATQVFGRSGAMLLPVLKGGSKAVRAYFDEFEALGGGMSEDFVNAADAAGDQIDRLKFTFQGLKSQIAVAVLPTLTRLTVWVTRGVAWLRKLDKQTNVVKTTLIALGSAIVIGGLAKLMSVLGLGKKSAGDVVLSLLKLGPIVLLVAALYLLFDDLFTLMTGGKSAIGDFLEETEGVEGKKKFVEDLKKTWDDLKKAIEDSGPALKELGKTMVDVLPGLIKGFAVLVKGAASFVELLIGAGRAAAAIGEATITGNWSKVGKEIDKAGDAVFGAQGLFANPTDIRNTPAWQSGTATPNVTVGGKPAPGPVSVEQKANINITVGGNTADPKATGQAVGKAAKDALHDSWLQSALNAVTGGV